jgi:eukaryotic-like serine/threonine-protein kinase
VTEDQGLANDAVGAVLSGQWKLLRLVGEGGLAAVYEAEGLQGQGRRAVKLLHPQFRTKANVVERFYTEARTCYELRHPHITTVDAYAYAEDGSPYIVMELLTGMNLEEFLNRGKPLPEADAVVVGTGILQALSAAHARGIVHRDLKPANVFLVRDANGRLMAKVLDFGIAKVMDAAGGMGTKTRTGALLGTPGYMSPEQVKDSKTVDARSDLWCVGVVLYETLCCRHPFDSSDILSRMVAVLRDPPKPISQVVATLAHWDPFFARALATSPADRFQTAEEMALAVRELGRALGPATAAPIARTLSMKQISEPPAGSTSAARAAIGSLPTAMSNPPPPPSALPGALPGALPTAMSNPPPPPSALPSALAAADRGSMVGAASESIHPATAASPGAAPAPRLPSLPPAVQGRAVAPPVSGLASAPAVRPNDDSLPIELIGPSRPSDGAPPTPFSVSVPPQRASRTQVSGDVPPSRVPGNVNELPLVRVVTAADAEPPKLVWWAVVLIALACLALGIAVGYLLASGAE